MKELNQKLLRLSTIQGIFQDMKARVYFSERGKTRQKKDINTLKHTRNWGKFLPSLKWQSRVLETRKRGL